MRERNEVFLLGDVHCRGNLHHLAPVKAAYLRSGASSEITIFLCSLRHFRKLIHGRWHGCGFASGYLLRRNIIECSAITNHYFSTIINLILTPLRGELLKAIGDRWGGIVTLTNETLWHRALIATSAMSIIWRGALCYGSKLFRRPTNITINIALASVSRQYIK